MRARDSVLNYEEQVGKYAQYVSDQIHKVIGDIGPRPSGCEPERKAQDYVMAHMKDTADTVVKEDFTLSPKAFMGWVIVDGICMLVASVFLILNLFGVLTASVFPVIALILATISVICILGEFLFYKELLDPFFPKSDSYNVICTRKSSGETKRRIVLSGHIDSSYEWRYTYIGGARLLTTIIAYGIAGMVADFIISILVVCGVTVPFLVVIMKIISIITIPAFILVLFYLNWGLCVPGANDNLTGVFASMSVMKFLVDNDIRFENTEVVSISMACEESGLRGAKAYAAAHAKEINDSGIDTVVICTDTLRDFDYMGIYSKDMSGTVKLDPQAVKLVQEASKTAGLDLPLANVFFGSSDAAAIKQGGLKSVCLAAMDPAPARYYHTRLDTEDNLDDRTIRAGIDTLLEATFLFDEKGFDL